MSVQNFRPDPGQYFYQQKTKLTKFKPPPVPMGLFKPLF